MRKKTLDVDAIRNELEGASLYFTKMAPPQSFSGTVRPKPGKKTTEPAEPMPDDGEESKYKQKIANKGAIRHTSKDASTHASLLAHKQDDSIETIRKSVKQVGKDTVFIRLTTDEKTEIASIVYTFNELYRGDGRKTSENEISRIALNFLLRDYRENGELSILARVLAALNA
jgi:hypothetical protein